MVKQCENQLDMTLFPGSLNVKIDDRTVHQLGEFLRVADVELIPDDPSFCAARIKKVTVNGIAAAVILPCEDVGIHDNRTLELIAPMETCRPLPMISAGKKRKNPGNMGTEPATGRRKISFDKIQKRWFT